jgi:heme/copper-type cytochrome/quinol oxidase subunit 2
MQMGMCWMCMFGWVIAIAVIVTLLWCVVRIRRLEKQQKG